MRRGLDQLAQHRHVADDRRVGGEVGGHRSLLDEQREGRGAADQRKLVRAPQLLLQREEVDRLAAIEQVEHPAIDRAMRLGVVVRVSQDLDDARQRLAALEEDGAEHRALGIEVVRRDAGRQLQRAHRCCRPMSSMRPDLPRRAAAGSTKIAVSRQFVDTSVDGR